MAKRYCLWYESCQLLMGSEFDSIRQSARTATVPAKTLIIVHKRSLDDRIPRYYQIPGKTPYELQVTRLRKDDKDEILVATHPNSKFPVFRDTTCLSYLTGALVALHSDFNRNINNCNRNLPPQVAIAMPSGIQQGSHVPPKGYQKGSHQVTKSTITNTPQPTASSSLVATNSGSPVASSSALINNSSVNEITKKRPLPKEAEQSVSNSNLPTDKKITSAPAGDPSNKSEREDPSPMKLRKRNDSADTELREFDFSVAHRLLNRHNLELSDKDLASLGGQQFLNDNIVDYWLSEFLSSKLTPEERNRTHLFSAFFYKRLTNANKKSCSWENDQTLSINQKRHMRVKNWTKNVDLFSKDFVIVPICEDLHWMVAIICFPGLNGIHNESGTKKLPYRNIYYPIHQKGKKGRVVLTATKAHGRQGATDVPQPDENPGQPIIKQPCILMFDSLRSDSSASSQSKVFNILRGYLQIEHLEKNGMCRAFNRLNFPGFHPVVPQQPNDCDCGIYLLSYVEAFFTRPIQSYWLPIQNLEEWFASSIVHTKRKETYEAIVAIIKAEAPENVKYIPQLTFHEGSETSEEESGKDLEENVEDQVATGSEEFKQSSETEDSKKL